jgi:hypothetical protein
VLVNAEPRSIILVGWALVVLVAILMLLFRGSEEAGPAVVFAVVAFAVSTWLWLRESRAALIASLVLGALWLVQFTAYTIADIVADDVQIEFFVTDVIAVVAGLAIVSGAVLALRARRVAAPTSTPTA